MFQRKAVIDFPESTFSYKFTIEKFSRFYNNKNCVFPAFCFHSEYWNFILSKPNTELNVVLNRHNSHTEVHLKTQVHISDSTERILFDVSKELILHINETKNTKYDLAATQVNNESVDVLFITVYLTIRKMSYTEINDFPTREEYTLQVGKTLCNSVLNMYDNNICTDVVLNVQGGKINAHKIILCSMSPVFANMFQQDRAESPRNVIDIEDIKIEAMKALVDFIYCRVNTHYNYDKAVDVYHAADRYRVLELRELCAKIAMQEINEHKALQLLQMADRHEDFSLKLAVTCFIKSNFKACVKTGWWADFANERSQLYEELMSAVG